jgi:hypothetical protein
VRVVDLWLIRIIVFYLNREERLPTESMCTEEFLLYCPQRGQKKTDRHESPRNFKIISRAIYTTSPTLIIFIKKVL